MAKINAASQGEGEDAQKKSLDIFRVAVMRRNRDVSWGLHFLQTRSETRDPAVKSAYGRRLSVTENRWQLLDFSDLGFWVFGIKENCLKTLITPSPFYGLRIQGVTYPLIENPLAPGILQLFLSEQLARDLIRGGTVVSLNNPSGSRSFRQEELLTIEQVILDRGVEENGTTLYGISLTDYFHLRQPLNVFISPQNACIFPSYILSN